METSTFAGARETADLAGKVSSSLASLDGRPSVLVFGKLSDEAPIAFLRVRKGWFNNGTRIVVACVEDNDADHFAHALRYRLGTAGELAKGLISFIQGQSDFNSIATSTGVSIEQLRRAAEALSGESAIVSTHALLNEQGGKEAIGALKSHASFNCYALGANEQGAMELGIHEGRATEEILSAAANGHIKALWLAGCDPLNDFHDKELARRALENVEFLVVQDTAMTESAHYASVVLPMAAPAEQDGTYTSCERRVQRVAQVIPALGDAKPAWRIFGECMVRAIDVVPFFNSKEVMRAIAQEHPSFARAQYDELSGEGVMLDG